MSLTTNLIERGLAMVDRARRAVMADAVAPMPPPSGRRRSWAHYGIVLPNLPNPHRALGLSALVGTPGMPIAANDQLITTVPSDTAYCLASTSAAPSDLRGYRIGADCELAADGSRLQFGAELLIEGRYPEFTLRTALPGGAAQLRLQASETATSLIHIPGVYEQRSVLCRARGWIQHHGDTMTVEGLAAFDYAAGLGLASIVDRPLPDWATGLPRFVAYQVVDVDDETQLLFLRVLGPSGIRIKNAVYERSLRHPSRLHSRGHVLVFHDHEPAPRTTPAGRVMSLPRRFAWRVEDDDGTEVVHLEAVAHDGWAYGFGAGYFGSCRYEARYRGRQIEGDAGIVLIDCR